MSCTQIWYAELEVSSDTLVCAAHIKKSSDIDVLVLKRTKFTSYTFPCPCRIY